jgi:endonuclease/exonuclease/phosphatase (EEP) superfamily protein YafD
VAWSALFVLGTLAALRVFHFDATHVLVWLNAFTRYLYLPAYVCVAWAAWQRRWGLMTLGLMVVACHVAWMVPDFVRDDRFALPQTGSPPASSPTLRVFFANVNGLNRQHQALLNEIAAANPDVIVLVEFTWPWHVALKNAPVMAPYKYGDGWMQSHVGSVNVFSKLPLVREVQAWVAGRAVQTADIQLGRHSLRLIGLHAPRPIGPTQYSYYEYWDVLVPTLVATTGPTLIVGDFNVTEHSRVYRDITADGLRSAHDDRGRGWVATWPNGMLPWPPIRIDHAFLSPELECVRIAEGIGLGSDHRPLIIDVRIREPASQIAHSVVE